MDSEHHGFRTMILYMILAMILARKKVGWRHFKTTKYSDWHFKMWPLEAGKFKTVTRV
jgi:hypothetical protein